MQGTTLFSSELIKGSTKLLILSVLLDKEMYGYEIIKTIKSRSNGSLTFSEGSVYPTLHSLEKSKSINSYWVEQTGSPDRKYYKISSTGITLLGNLIKEWSSFVSAIKSVCPSSAGASL